jgi:hypothetical protein
MGVDDAGIVAGLFGVMLALVRLAEGAIKAALAKRNGDTRNHLLENGREQLTTLRNIDREIAAIRGDLRAASIEQSHLQKTVDALHRRIDTVTGPRSSDAKD